MNGWSESLRQELQPDIRTKHAVDQMYEAMSITAEDIAEVIAFSVGWPQRMTLNEILIRPTGQAL
jgi:NADP-dependent 3-hydroxy acid dehydrogenase YdfG